LAAAVLGVAAQVKAAMGVTLFTGRNHLRQQCIP
jgi:hypothetical protein